MYNRKVIFNHCHRVLATLYLQRNSVRSVMSFVQKEAGTRAEFDELSSFVFTMS